MGKEDAEVKFFDAVNSFRMAEQAAYANRYKVDQSAFEMVIIDLDAALPGLDGVTRGRALLIKAASLNWLYWAQVLGNNFSRLGDPEVNARLDSLRKEALSLALEGRDLVSTSDLPWANDLVRSMQS